MTINKLLIALSLFLAIASCSKMPPIDTSPKQLICDGVVKLETEEGQRMEFTFGTYYVVNGNRDHFEVLGNYSPDGRAACQIKNIK